jgi:ABC-type phosphate/phosphonate transport system substrate-binding protein
MKKVLSLLIAAMFVLSLTGCGMKNKIENKIGEKIGEKIVEGTTDNKVDIEGDKVTVKGEDGSEVTFGGNEWPKNDLMKDIPKFEKGTINTAAASEELNMIIIEGVEKKDFQNYWEKLKDRFSKEPFSLETGDTLSYGGVDEKGIGAQFSYNSSDKSFTLSISKSKQ